MVLVTSVFLTQLLCLLVPCDPEYQRPDLRPLAKKEIQDGWSTKLLPQSEEELHQAIEEIQQSSEGQHQSFINVRQLKSGSSSYSFQQDECEDEHPFVTTKNGVIEGYRIQVVGGRKICAFEGIPFAEAPETQDQLRGMYNELVNYCYACYALFIE